MTKHSVTIEDTTIFCFLFKVFFSFKLYSEEKSKKEKMIFKISFINISALVATPNFQMHILQYSRPF